MSLDLAHLQKYIDNDHEMRRVVIAIDGVGPGFGFIETELLKRTGLETQKLRELISRLQRSGVVEVKCTQVGTSGPYDYFFRFCSGIKVTINITTGPSPS